MGLVPPADGFLAGLRAECDRVGALLIFDEVITGFRVGRGGAQGRFGVRPDLSCFGKVIGGGLNVGAFGGRAEVMDHLAPLGPVYQAGTLSGNPLATAAGLAALDLLDDGAYELARRPGHRAGRRASRPRFDGAGLIARTSSLPGLVGLYFGDHLPGRLRRRPGDRRGRVRRVLPRPARSRGRPRAGRLRGRVPRPGPRRRGDRRHRRGGRRRPPRTSLPPRPASAPPHRDRKPPMEQLGPLLAAVEATVADLVDRKVRRADLGPRPHALAGRPHRGRRPARLARRGRPRCSPTASGSTRSPTHRVRRRPHPRGRHGHGRLEPVPRGAGPHLPALGPAAPSSGCSTPPTRPRWPASATSAPPTRPCSSPRRSPARPSRPAATSQTSGPAAAGPSSSRSSPTRAPSWPKLAADRAASGPLFENRPTSAAATRRCRTSGSCRPRLAGRRLAGPPRHRPIAMAERLAPAADPAAEPRPAARRRSWARPCRPAATSSRSSSTSDIDTFGLWLEQLLAESTGKQGTGVIPSPASGSARPRSTATTGSSSPSASTTASCRSPTPATRWSSSAYGGPLDLGAQVLLWELATALCGAVLGINPFDQPNVAEAKEATAEVLDGPDHRPSRSSPAAPLLDQVRPGRLRRHPGLRRPRVRRGRRARGRPHRPSATGSGWPPPSGSGPASSTPPASSTRAARRPACSSRWSATTPTDVAIPGAAVRVLELKQAQAAGDLLHPAPPRPAGRRGSRSTTCVEVTR